ncbi:DMT family transporter [Candidatus Gottesmanbacteria bacterium]|nr:DMT family transporter [Candidatus Gottesmanbacteria bacterium]
MTARHKAILAIILFSLLGAGTAPVIKIGLAHIPPLTYAFLRFFLATIILLPFFLTKTVLTRKKIITLLPLSLLATINIVLFVLGLRLTTATIGQLLYAGTPLLTTALLFVLFGERLRKIKLIGILIGFVGVLIVIFLPLLESGNIYAGDLIGNTIIALAVVCWSLYMVYSKKYLSRFSPLILTAIFIVTTTVVLFPVFLYELTSYAFWWKNIGLVDITSIAYVAIVATIVTYILNQYAIKHGGSMVASLSFYLTPLVTYGIANILLREVLTTGLVIGGMLALFGVYLATKQ